ncbi:MAG: polysaccharide deacetylase family protein [Candidatus Nanopelagicales bacterium]
MATTATSADQSQPTASPSPTAAQTPDPDTKVEWRHGEDPPGGDIGIPRYAGWYEHAVGQPTKEKVIYLTVDDGPSPYTEELLKIFTKNDAVGTWFLIGNQAQGQPELVKRIHQAGMPIGNHSWNHPNLNTLDAEQVRAQLEATNKAVGPVMGSCMRPPYGLINSEAAHIAESLGQTPVIWTGHATDWSSPPVDQMVATFKSFTRPGAVILMHDGGGDRANTVEAMRTYIPWLRKQGYRMEPIPSCLGSIPAKETHGAVVAP